MGKNGKGGDFWQPPRELNEAPPTRNLPRQHPGQGRKFEGEGGGPLRNLAGMTEDTRSNSYDRSAHRDEKEPY